MKVEVKDIENSQKELTFEIPYEAFTKKSEEELAKVAPEAKIAGFRPGKAPKDVILKQYSHRIKSTAIERVISDAMSESFVANGINPLSQPAISNMVFEDNKPITFTARVDVFPKVKLDKYTDLEVERITATIGEDDINETLEEIRGRHGALEPVTDRKDVRDGDVVVIDFLGKIDGEPFDGGKGESYSLTIGSGQFIPGFEENVIGMNINDTKDIKVPFPKDYHAEQLAGKDAIFTVTVHEIKHRVTPKLDDDFAKDIDPKAESLQHFKEKIKRALEAEAESNAKYDTFSKLLAKIVEHNEFEVPNSFVKEQAERLAYNNMSQLYSMGINPESVGIDFEAMVARNLEQGKSQVKHALVINEISKNHSIIVDDADVDKFFARHAELQERPAEEIKADMERNNQLDSIRNDILGDKVFEYLSTVNKIKEKKVSRKEYAELRLEKEKAGKKAKKEKDDKSDKKEKDEKKEVSEKKEKKSTKKKED